MTIQFSLWRHLPHGGALRACHAALRWLAGIVQGRARHAGRIGARPEPPPIRWQF